MFVAVAEAGVVAVLAFFFRGGCGRIHNLLLLLLLLGLLRNDGDLAAFVVDVLNVFLLEFDVGAVVGRDRSRVGMKRRLQRLLLLLLLWIHGSYLGSWLLLLLFGVLHFFALFRHLLLLMENGLLGFQFGDLFTGLIGSGS